MLFWGVWGLQKLAKLENMFPNIIEGCFCQQIFVRYLFEEALHFTLKSGGLMDLGDNFADRKSTKTLKIEYIC